MMGAVIHALPLLAYIQGQVAVVDSVQQPYFDHLDFATAL
jgi:hypothetical protein